MKVLVQVLKKIDFFVFTCLTAGITEEIIFRGYLLPRLEILLKIKIYQSLYQAYFLDLYIMVTELVFK
jgi:membrane protease YdiL (CAAX protease family)